MTIDAAFYCLSNAIGTGSSLTLQRDGTTRTAFRRDAAKVLAAQGRSYNGLTAYLHNSGAFIVERA